MPVEKVPVVHRFGIISHNQRLELQERLLEKAVEQATARPYDRIRNPNELQETFVHLFNGATTVEEKERYEEQARKHIERLKRKCGLSKQCQIANKQLDEAWVDLTILSQCKGKIQEESLDILISTLDQATFDHGHIQGLFFLAETALYWLRTDAINSPYLRISEIKLLKMAYMVFLRLFYHHMVGDLRGHRLFKSRLYMYLDGLSDYQEAYSPYPNAHLCLRYVIEVGKVIFLDGDLDPGEMKEAESHDRSHFTQSATGSQGGRSGISAVSRSVHDLTPTLWHSLDVWRCVTVTGKSVDEALYSLARCGLGMSLESWIDGAAAMIVLGEAAKRDLSTLRVLQSLASGLIPSYITTEEDMGNHADIHEHKVNHHHHHHSDSLRKPDADLPDDEQAEEDLKELQHALREAERERLRSPKTPHKVTRQSQRAGASRPVTREDNYAAGFETGQRAAAGTQYNDRAAISPTTYRNSPLEDTPGIQGWQWEVGVVYTELLANLVVHGSLSSIQKRALLGNHNTVEEMKHEDVVPPLTSAGLIDMLNFHISGELTETDPARDWSWRIRYTAVQGLVGICGHLSGNKMADGLYNIAWRSLLEANSFERDERVLEALKVGQVTVGQQQDSKTSAPSHVLMTNTAAGRLADKLAKRYLPPVSIVKPAPTLPPRRAPPKYPTKKPQNPRTTLREEKKIAELTDEQAIPDFKSRTNCDLMRIVEDQWRKELQEKLRVEEEEKLEAMKSQVESLSVTKNTTNLGTSTS